MNHEQWTQLLESTKGHTPGPWGVVRKNGEVHCVDSATTGTSCFWACHDDVMMGAPFLYGENPKDIPLAAAAPDLLAEVERLRAWLEYLIAAEAVITRQYTTVESTAPLLANSARVLLARALNGAEVPK